MLNSDFLEGSTKVIELNDDKPQTILDFCHIIHHRYDSITGMDAARLREFIVLADMRDSREALRPYMETQLFDYLVWFKSNGVYPDAGLSMPESLG